MTGICFCRSDFSIGESMLKVTQIAKIAKEKNYSAVALCDTMTLSSLIEASQACAKENIPLISGVRLRIVEDATVKDKKQNNRAWFPKLYFKNEEGLRIAYKLLTMSFADDNFYYVPRLSFEHLLNEITTDVIISLGDQHSQVGTRLLDERVQMLVNKIGAENIVAECIPFNTPIFDRLTKESLCIAEKYGLKLMYSDLCMYSEPKNKKALIALSAIASKGESVTFNTPWLNKPVYDTAYIKDYTDYIQMCKDQMNRIKSRYNIDVTPLVEAVKFSAFGFEKLFSYKWEAKKPCLPQMDKSPFDKLKELCKEGFKNKLTKPILGYMPDPTELPKYAARLQYELDIIEKLDFSNYFLLVKDILDWARQNGMGGSYGRGSSGGCLIAFLLDIVETDPIRFGLMFERFINPSRHDLPDVDMDISSSKRQELIARIIQDYGSENVASISNYITLGASGVIRACGRVYGLPINEYNCSSKVPSEHGVSYSLSQAVAVVPEIELFATKYPEVWETALQLEGCISAYGVHAAGLIVAGEPLINRAAVENRRGNQVVCWDKLVVESMGLIKMDLLGLTTLDVLNLAKQYVKDNFNVDLDLLSIPLDDKETLKLFGEGKTSGVFQFEVAGALLKRLAVNEPLRFEDLVAATALNRPGPMDSGLLEDYVAIKQGLKDEHYDHPNLKEALKETYGVIVYQEQVMKASMDLAGFTASEADFLRKCVVGDSVVALDDDFVTIEDLYRNKEKYIGKNIFSLNEKYKTVKDKIIDIYDNGYADVYKIKTKLGCELECTDDHKLLKLDGFTELKNLNVGDSIAINKKLGIAETTTKFSNKKLRLLSMIIGDGCLTQKHYYFCNTDKRLVDNFVSLFNDVYGFCRVTEQKTKKEKTIYYIYFNTNKEARKDIDNLILGKKSAEKHFGNYIYSLNQEQYIYLLSGLIDTDGFVLTKQQKIEYSTTSKELAIQIVNILSKLGIFAKNFRKETKHKGNPYISYKIYVTGEDAILLQNLLKEHLFSYKKELLEEMTSTNGTLYNKYCLPKEIINIISEERKAQNLTWKEINKLCGVKNGAMSSAINFSNPQQKLNRNRVKKFNLAFNSQKIDDFINCDVIWDDIESIEFVGKKHVYDLQTNNNHNYLANNIVVHNCMGKKDLKKMQTYKQQWIEGCQKISNMHPFDAEALWNKIEAFAGYGFNKSHSVEYTLLSFASMYIKAHYPTAFYAATLSVLPEEKLKNIVKDADSNGIKVLPPDINLAGENFTIIDDKTIMIPFNRVKGVGPTAVKAILDARADGSFTSYQDFETRVTGKCNKRHRESLNKIGAFANIIPGQQPSSDITRLKDQYELLPELVIKTLKSTKRISGTDVKKALDKNNEMGQSLMEPLGKKYVRPYSGKVIRYVVIFDGPNKSDLSSGKFANVRQFEAISTALNVASITKEEGYWTGLMKTPKEQKEITTPELALNLPLLQRELQLLKPEIIVLMGPDVIRQFAKDVKKPSEAIGQSFYDAEYDATFIIGMNPGMIYFRPEKQKDLNSVFEKVATMIH